jgi:ABC-type polar amino acid transport system ATPase subunit
LVANKAHGTFSLQRIKKAMIKSFAIDNFKSLVDFRLPPRPHQLGALTVLVGLNGAGKSTVLQAFDFVGHLANGQVMTWLEKREWTASDLTSRLLNKRLISFEIQVEHSEDSSIVWRGSFNTAECRCTAESILVNNDHQVLRLKDGQLAVSPRHGSAAVEYPLRAINYEGSSLSFISPKDVHPAIDIVKTAAANLRSLDLLSPQAMRRRAKDGSDIGYGGERLSAYIHGLSVDAKKELMLALKEFYPHLAELGSTSLRSGWKDLRIVEEYQKAPGHSVRVESGARQINDGLLRILAVLAETSSGRMRDATSVTNSCVLFDEIENGINPEIIQKLVQYLLESKRQIIVTTHSPLVLNYFPDAVAKKSVILLFRDGFGSTRSARLFDLPSAREKLDFLGPGEVYVDSNIEGLTEEALASLSNEVP